MEWCPLDATSCPTVTLLNQGRIAGNFEFYWRGSTGETMSIDVIPDAGRYD
jgi:hypothetical protein